MDVTIGFSASNRYIQLLRRSSDCRWGFIISGIKKRKYQTRFCHISTTRNAMGKWTAACDSAHQIGVSALSRDVLIVDQGDYRWALKSCEIRDVFASALGSNKDKGEWMLPFDSAH